MNRSRTLALILILTLAALGAAKPPFLKVFMATYKIKEDSAIGKARCLNCHMPPGPPRRNPYGIAVGNALFAAHSRMVTPEILKTVEQQKGDDGMAFITKIKADTPPAMLMKPKPKPTKGTSKPRAKKGRLHAKKGHVLFVPGAGQGLLVLLSVAPVGLILSHRRRRPV